MRDFFGKKRDNSDKNTAIMIDRYTVKGGTLESQTKHPNNINMYLIDIHLYTQTKHPDDIYMYLMDKYTDKSL